LEIFNADYVIVGTGLAGLYSALQASHYGTVALLCKAELTESNSFHAQGGIAAAVMPGDSTDLHYQDTIKTGRGLCSEQAVRILVDEGKERIEELLKQGMPFDTDSGDELAAGLEGGHSKRRVLHAGGDSTGKEIVEFLHKSVSSNSHIRVFENIFVFDLMVQHNACYGVYGYNKSTGKTHAFLSSNTILASGGLAGIYVKTTNPSVAVGDGIALAYEYGVEISNLEMLQFHPTCFYTKTGEGFLISEAVRGEGAHLLNEKKKRFMPAIDPMAELAPRDLVSISIFNQMKKNSVDHVYLDLSPIDSELVKTRFSHIYQEVLKNGIDITKELLPVAPAAHYTIGGIKTDVWGRTNIRHLYAVGEAASNGVHGANRLASNSLLECLVFGTRATKATFNTIVTRKAYRPPDREFTLDSSLEKAFEKERLQIGNILIEHAGIIRNEKGLRKALTELNKISVEEKDEYYSKRLKMLKELSILLVQSALTRQETRGVHMRQDFPEESEEMKMEIIQRKDTEIMLQPVE
jgi:L-aspartate oxidase